MNTNDDEYYSQPDHGHNKQNEYPLGPCLCVLAVLGMVSYLCAYLVRLPSV